MSADTPAWVRDAVFYQIFPDRFARSGRLPDPGNLEPWDTPPTPCGFKGGDLQGVADRLDYFVDLGVTAIYFCPVFASASNHRYHTYDYYRVDPLLGGNNALRHLLDRCHNHGIRVILDGVFNHVSRGFWQFHHVLENGSASPFRDWFHFDEDRLHGRRPFQPYPADTAAAELAAGVGSRDAIGYAAWWNLPALPTFNTDCPEVREFLIGVAEHWISFGIDGWRLDVPNEIDDDDFWREFRERIRRIKPDAYIVGEVWSEAGRWLQGDMWDAVMNYQVTAACLGFFGGSHLDLLQARQPSSFSYVQTMTADAFALDINRVLKSYPPEITACQLNLLDSHDMPRFLTCCSNDVAALKMAWLFVCLLPGAPCIYYGDEVGMQGGHDPDCRRGFPKDESTWNLDLRNWYRQCIRWRKATTEFRRGEVTVRALNADVAVITSSADRDIAAIFNSGSRAQDVQRQEVNGGNGTLHLAARSAQVTGLAD